MLSDEETDDACQAWRKMTQAEQAATIESGNSMRNEALLRMPFKAYQLETWRTLSQEISVDISENWEADWQGAAPAIELAILKKLFSPEALAWDRACAYLDDAIHDQAIAKFPALRLQLERVSEALQEFSDGGRAGDVIAFLVTPEATKSALSQRGREAAMAKNSGARAWVQQEWQNRQDTGQSKASFARQYAPMVKKKFPKDSVSVTPETIARDWLPKGNV